ncbi:ubiquitin carboxyl-terminal hydrolase 7-like isoform X2 [Contarinia nasturtii]|uniref:ubiquitin carboxyl-terminal hydrolase 7-like isoform X2 n=1 Tax=Contarinia nasturtii TaxID=265458 RepID=UPI0012D47096|nr:ubiquitin carboxyl-terminal hydrolase 7-like isoform X2 [Contarinia nasturtii]
MGDSSEQASQFALKTSDDTVLFVSAHIPSNFEKKVRLNCCIINVDKFETGEELTSKTFFVQSLPFYIRVTREKRNISKRLQKQSPLSFHLHVGKDIKRWSSQFQIKVESKAENTIRFQWVHECELNNRSTKISYSIEWDKVSELKKLTCTIDISATLPNEGYAWPSYAATGYSGLMNEGATCYINSLLQSLYHTNEFRRIVYGLEIEPELASDSFAFWLKYIFYTMQLGELSEIRTTNMIKCFDWEEMTTTAQQDVHEFLRRLIDNLEQIVEGTPFGERLTKLFVGELETITTCETVGFVKKKKETFWDLQLSIDEDDDLYGAFQTYLQTLILSDYEHEHGKDEAKQEFRFIKLPPVLHVQLKRFQYNMKTNTISKNNKPFKFYSTLDLSQYCTDAIYTLHSVLVHSGKVDSGHYVAYISPKLNGEWFEFNDQVVCKCSISDAIRFNYGSSTCSKNAYILVYIKDSCKSQIMSDVSIQDVMCSDLINAETAKELLELTIKKQWIEVIVYTPERLQMNDTLKAGESIMDKRFGLKFLIDKQKSYSSFLDILGRAFKIQNVEKNLVVWALNSQKSAMHILDNDNLIDSEEEVNKIFKKGCQLFVEICSAEQHLNAFDKTKDALIFIKQYDGDNLTFVGHSYFSLEQTVRDIQIHIREMIQYDGNDKDIAIIGDMGVDEKYKCRKLHTEQLISKIVSKNKDTHSGTVTFELLSEQHPTEKYLSAFNSSNVSTSQSNEVKKPLLVHRSRKLPSNVASTQIENGIRVHVHSDIDHAELFSQEFDDTTSLLNIVEYIADLTEKTCECIQLLDVDNNVIECNFWQTNIESFYRQRNIQQTFTRLRKQKGIVFSYRIIDQDTSEIYETDVEMSYNKTPLPHEPMDFEHQSDFYDASPEHSIVIKDTRVMFKNCKNSCDRIAIECNRTDLMQHIIDSFITQIKGNLNEFEFFREDGELFQIPTDGETVELFLADEDFIDILFEHRSARNSLFPLSPPETNDILVLNSNIDFSFKDTDKLSLALDFITDALELDKSNAHFFNINDVEIAGDLMNATVSEFLMENEAKIKYRIFGEHSITLPLVNIHGRKIDELQFTFDESTTVDELCHTHRVIKQRVVQIKDGYIIGIVSPDTKVIDLNCSHYEYRLDQYQRGLLISSESYYCKGSKMHSNIS